MNNIIYFLLTYQYNDLTVYLIFPNGYSDIVEVMNIIIKSDDCVRHTIDRQIIEQKNLKYLIRK